MTQGLRLVGMGAHSLTVNDSCKERRFCFDEVMIARPFGSLRLANDPGMTHYGHLLL